MFFIPSAWIPLCPSHSLSTIRQFLLQIHTHTSSNVEKNLMILTQRNSLPLRCASFQAENNTSFYITVKRDILRERRASLFLSRAAALTKINVYLFYNSVRQKRKLAIFLSSERIETQEKCVIFSNFRSSVLYK